MKVVLIDDESLAREVIRHYLQDHPQITIVAECADGFEGLKAIQLYQPDFIFLDIQMPKITGFEMLELLECPPAIIFTTAFDEYAIKAFEVNAIDYLLKPVEKARFDAAIQKLPAKLAKGDAVQHLLDGPMVAPQQNGRIVVKVDGAIKIIPVNELIYIEADDDYVKLSTQQGNFQKNRRISFYEQTLDQQQFIRIHRSYLVNLAQVTKIELKEKESYVVLLKTGIWLPVSKTGYAKLKLALGM